MSQRLFQVLPSVARKIHSETEIEADFCESLRLYLDNFDSVTIACPVTTEIVDSGLRRCRRVDELPWRERFRLIPLPSAPRISEFLHHYGDVKKILRSEIENANYLLFSPHTLIGDWPLVATKMAIKMNRPYAIDADVVYDKVAQVNWAATVSLIRKVKRRLALARFRKSYRFSLKHSAVALLQGQDVYNAFSSFSPNPHKTYHMPVSSSDFISESELSRKIDDVTFGTELSICYVGRAIEMKGAMDWLNTINELIKGGVAVKAHWLGDGSLLRAMKSTANALGIADKVVFSGFVSDRAVIMRTLRNSDIFLFCHKTPESPRCLIEALASGCPLVGYGSAYANEIVAQGGGRFVPVGNWKELAILVKALSENRAELRELIRCASASGRLFERDTTMQHRIDLIKRYCEPECSPSV